MWRSPGARLRALRTSTSRRWTSTGRTRRSGSATSAASRPTTPGRTSARCERRCSIGCPVGCPMCGAWRPSRGRRGRRAMSASCSRRSAGNPVLDLVLLGIGPDGHCASLFPGQAALDERERLAVGVERPGLPPLGPARDADAAGHQRGARGALPRERAGEGRGGRARVRRRRRPRCSRESGGARPPAP